MLSSRSLIAVARMPFLAKGCDRFAVIARFQQNDLLPILDHQRGVETRSIDQRLALRPLPGRRRESVQ